MRTHKAMMYGGTSFGSAAYGSLSGAGSIPRYIGRFALRIGRRAFTVLEPVRAAVVYRGRRAFTVRLPET